MLARDESKGPSQSGGTNGPTLKIPQGEDWLWQPGQVNRPASRTAFQVEGFAWIMAQRQESSETVRGPEAQKGWGGGMGGQGGKVRAHCQESRPRGDRLMGSGQGCSWLSTVGAADGPRRMEERRGGKKLRFGLSNGSRVSRMF